MKDSKRKQKKRPSYRGLILQMYRTLRRLDLVIDRLTSFVCFCFKKTKEGVPLAEFMYIVFTRIPGESYCGCSAE